MKAIGDRMKQNYESRSKMRLTRRTPVIIRVDGRAFHTFTRGCDKPFDVFLMDAMVGAACAVANDMQGCKLVYVQSDEASFLLTDYDSLETEAWFDYEVNKIVSISAACMTAHFNDHFHERATAMFDSRAFNIPPEEVTNYFVWRAKDWERNSLQMYCQSMFSHRELHGKNRAAMHEMLHEKGKNWTTDLNDQQRNGTFLIRGDRGYAESSAVLPTYEAINPIVEGVFAQMSQPTGDAR